jgi:hypothetical protein
MGRPAARFAPASGRGGSAGAALRRLGSGRVFQGENLCAGAQEKLIARFTID